MQHQRQQIIFREATVEDALSLAPRLCAADVKEVFISSGLAPAQALTYSIEGNEANSFAAIEVSTGLVIAMGGCAGHGAVGIPWLLSADAALKYPAVIICEAREKVLEWSSKHHTLTNMVHDENIVSLRWLKHIGFTLGELYPEYGVGKGSFYQFYRINYNV
jgi:hypothetical protein